MSSSPHFADSPAGGEAQVWPIRVLADLLGSETTAIVLVLVAAVFALGWLVHWIARPWMPKADPYAPLDPTAGPTAQLSPRARARRKRYIRALRHIRNRIGRERD